MPRSRQPLLGDSGTVPGAGISCDLVVHNDCPSSKSNGYHCNHSWSHDACCWCGQEWGEEGAQTQRVIHMPSGRKGRVEWPLALSEDKPRVQWDSGSSSAKDHADLRTLPDGRRV
jgi:hypothetical protein